MINPRILSFSGFSLQTSEISSYGAGFGNLPKASHVYVDQIDAEPSAAGAFTVGLRTLAVEIHLQNYENHSLTMATLAEKFRPGTEGNLVAMFDDENRYYQQECRVVSFTPEDNAWNICTVLFDTDETAWRSAEEITDTVWSVSADGDTRNITVGGYSKTRLSMDVVATSLPAVGWAHRDPYQLINKVGYGFGIRPWMISLNTAALISASKMMSSCYDIRVMVDGQQCNRWIASPNTAATKIWFNLAMDEGQTLELKTAIGASASISQIEFKKSSDSRAKLKKIQTHGYFVHGTEWIEYDGVDTDECTVAVKGRAVYGTTMQAHSVGDLFNWMQHAVVLLYGHLSTTSPDADDAHYNDTKPMFDLANSTNDSWVYDTTSGFYDEAHPLRPGQFKPYLERVGNLSDYYAIYNSDLASNTGMGMSMLSWYKGSKLQAEKATIAWGFGWPGKINTVSMTGRKYRSTANWAGTSAVRLEYSNDQNKWYTSWSEGTPSSAGSWQSITQSAKAANSAKYVRFALTGTLPATSSENYFEVLTVTIAFVSANNPTGTLLAEQDNILLDFTLSNSTTGESIKFFYPVRADIPLTLDGENNVATFGNEDRIESAQAAITLDDNSREIWMNLVPGVNSLIISSTAICEMDITLRHFERRLL